MDRFAPLGECLRELAAVFKNRPRPWKTTIEATANNLTNWGSGFSSNGCSGNRKSRTKCDAAPDQPLRPVPAGRSAPALTHIFTLFFSTDNLKDWIQNKLDKKQDNKPNNNYGSNSYGSSHGSSYNDHRPSYGSHYGEGSYGSGGSSGARDDRAISMTD